MIRWQLDILVSCLEEHGGLIHLFFGGAQSPTSEKVGEWDHS